MEMFLFILHTVNVCTLDTYLFIGGNGLLWLSKTGGNKT